MSVPPKINLAPLVDDVVFAAANASRSNGRNGNSVLAKPEEKAAEKAEASMVKADAKPEVPAANASVEDAPTVTDKAMGAAGGAMQLAGFAVPIAMAADAVRGGARKAGGFFGITNSSAPVEPPKSLNAYTFSELGKKTGLGKSVGGAAQRAFDQAAALGAVSDRTGLSDWRVKAHEAKSERHFVKAKELAIGLQAKELAQPIQELQAAVHGGANAKQAAGRIEKALEAVRNAPEAINSKPVKKLVNAAEGVLYHNNHAAGWSKPGEAIKNMPKSVAKTPVTHGLMNGAFVGMSGMSMAEDARSFSKDLAILKQMYADMTGQDAANVSTAKVMLGNVPEPVAKIRSQMMKKTVVKEIADAMNVAINVKQMIDHRFTMGKSLLAFGAAQGVSAGADAMMGESILPMYKELSNAQKRNEDIPAEAYAAFIMAASPRFKTLGLGSEITQEVAKQVKEQNLSAAKILEKGVLDQLGDQAVAKISAAATHKAQPQPESTQWREAMANGGKRLDRKIVGEHTGDLMREKPGNAVQQGVMGGV